MVSGTGRRLHCIRVPQSLSPLVSLRRYGRRGAPVYREIYVWGASSGEISGYRNNPKRCHTERVALKSDRRVCTVLFRVEYNNSLK